MVNIGLNALIVDYLQKLRVLKTGKTCQIYFYEISIMQANQALVKMNFGNEFIQTI
jgi:hypothetical protein